MRLFSLLLFSIITLSAMAQEKRAYRIFDTTGQEVTYAEMMEACAQNDLVFFGELHNNPIAHWLQLELTRDLYTARDSHLILGAEMFEADNQLLLNEYLLQQISEKNFEDEARLWNNYATDYKPLVEFAKANQLYFVATNIPRRYANLVYREGLESLNDLSATAKQYIAPLPITVDMEIPSYKDMLDMMGGHGGETLVQAQAVKDATMAYFIDKYWREGYTFIHYNGSYHSNRWEGIVWYLKNEFAPERSIVTINTVEQEDISAPTEDNAGLADFTICVPNTMTKTY